ncbi:MAG: PHP domain-containing protein, partial [Cyclobacteriaceae bacterium]
MLLIIITNFSCRQQQPMSEAQETKRWVKGNLHTHSYWSDGDEFPEVIMGWYKSNGYQFVALSDHNILAEGEKWIVVPEDSIYQAGFANYLQNYGSDWVEHKEDTGQIQVKLKTYDQYKERFEEPEQFLIIRSEEITDRFEDKPLHMNATNIQSKIDPQGGNSVKEVLQNNIDAVLDQREQTGEPIIPHINHPNFGYAIALEDMIALRGERFFELYNGHHMVNNLGDSAHMSTEEMW